MTSRKTRLVASSVLAGGVALLCLATSLPARAGAFYIQEQSTRGTGRAFSGEVADTGPESLWWNPASIASTPATAFGSITGIFPHTVVTDAGSTLTVPTQQGPVTVPVGGDPIAYNPVLDGVVGAGGYAQPIGDRFAVGVSLAAPFELVTKYPGDSFARYQARKSRLYTADIQITGAMKINEWLDLGAGADVIYTTARLTQSAPNLVPGAPDAFVDLTGDTWDAGYNVGLQAHPKDRRWIVGLSYRSAVTRTLTGDVSVSGLVGPLAAGNFSTNSGRASFTTPWIGTAGVRYTATRALTLDLQVQEIGWNEFKDIQINSIGLNEVLAQNYKNVTTVAFGGDYSPNPIMTFRVGAQWNPTPTPDVGRTLRVPDGDRWQISGGGELTLGKHLTVEGALEYVTVQDSRVNSQQAFFQGTPALTAANYLADVRDSDVFLISGGARWKF